MKKNQSDKEHKTRMDINVSVNMTMGKKDLRKVVPVEPKRTRKAVLVEPKITKKPITDNITETAPLNNDAIICPLITERFSPNQSYDSYLMLPSYSTQYDGTRVMPNFPESELDPNNRPPSTCSLPHICDYGIKLACGHFKCMPCLRSMGYQTHFACARCEQEYETADLQEYINNKEIIANQIQTDNKKFFKETLKKYRNTYEKLEVLIEQCEELPEDDHDKYDDLCYEINLIVELLRNYLDNLTESTECKIIEFGENATIELLNCKADVEEILPGGLAAKDKQRLSDLNGYLRKLSDVNQFFEDISKMIELPPTDVYDEPPVVTEKPVTELKLYLENKTFTKFEIRMNITHMLVLPYNHLLIVLKQRIEIYDSHFNYIRGVDRRFVAVDQNKWSCNVLDDEITGVATNGNDSLFFVNAVRKEITRTNLVLYVKDRCNVGDQFKINDVDARPKDLAYFGYIFVTVESMEETPSAQAGNAIVKLRDDLEYVETFYLKSRPNMIKISEAGFACVSLERKSFAIFDVLNGFKILFKVDVAFNILNINLLYDRFYICLRGYAYESEQTILRYSGIGEELNELVIRKPAFLGDFNCLCDFNGQLLNSFHRFDS